MLSVRLHACRQSTPRAWDGDHESQLASYAIAAPSQTELWLNESRGVLNEIELFSFALRSPVSFRSPADRAGAGQEMLRESILGAAYKFSTKYLLPPIFMCMRSLKGNKNKYREVRTGDGIANERRGAEQTQCALETLRGEEKQKWK